MLCRLLLVLASAFLTRLAAHAAEPVSFRRDVAPILAGQCQGCHGAEKAKGNYRVDTFARLTAAGESRAAPVTAGDPTRSSLYRLVATADEDDRMPQKADPLPAAQVATIKRWIEGGARFDGPDPTAPIASLLTDAGHPSPPEVYRRPMPVTALAFSPDGRTIAAGGYHEVTLWSAADGKLAGRIPRVAQRTFALAFSPDGKRLAVAGGAPGVMGEVRVCDVDARSPGRVLERTADVVLAVRFSPDGARLAAGGTDNAVRVFDAASGKRELLIEQHADWVTDLAFSPDGASVATASRDKSARVFDAKTGATRSAFLGHEETVLAVAWGGEGRAVHTAGRDRKIRAWNPADGKQAGVIDADAHRLASGRAAVFAVVGRELRQYGEEKRELVRAWPAGEWVQAVAVDAGRGRAATGDARGDVRVYAIEQGEAVLTFVAAPGYGKK
jgi:hypothetical protein